MAKPQTFAEAYKMEITVLASNAPFDFDGIAGRIDDADELVYRLPLIVEAQLVPHSQVIIDLRIVRFLVQLPFRDTLHQLLLFSIQLFDAPADVSKQGIVRSRQAIHQRADLSLNLRKLNVQRRQLGVNTISFTPPERFELSHLFAHFIVDDLFKLIGINRSGTLAGFGVHFVRTEEVAGACGRVVLIHQSVPTDAAFDLSRQPCVLSFLIYEILRIMARIQPMKYTFNEENELTISFADTKQKVK